MSDQLKVSDQRTKDLVAGDAFRNSVVSRAEATHNGCPLWHGWVIMDAFLAGAAHARASGK